MPELKRKDDDSPPPPPPLVSDDSLIAAGIDSVGEASLGPSVPMLIDTMLAATILKYPDPYLPTIVTIKKQLQPLWENVFSQFLHLENPPQKTANEHKKIIDFMYKVISDAYMPGQFVTIGEEQSFDLQLLLQPMDSPQKQAAMAKLKEKAIEFNAFMNSKEPSDLAKEILAVKTIGGALADYPGSMDVISTEILSDEKKQKIKSFAIQVKPPNFFSAAHRGRKPGVTANPSREIGILQPNQSQHLPEEFQPLIAHDKEYNRLNFTNYPFANGFNFTGNLMNFPLIGGPSGSMGVIMVGAFAADENFFTHVDASNTLGMAATAFLVGGGYHSVYECMGMYYFPLLPNPFGLGVAEGMTKAEQNDHKKKELAYFLNIVDKCMPYSIRDGVLAFDKSKLAPGTEADLQQLSKRLNGHFGVRSNINLQDVRLKDALITQFENCFHLLTTRRRTRHASEQIIEQMTVLAAHLVRNGAIQENQIKKMLETVTKAYPKTKSNRAAGYDYEDSVNQFNQLKKNALEKFTHLLQLSDVEFGQVLDLLRISTVEASDKNRLSMASPTARLQNNLRENFEGFIDSEPSPKQKQEMLRSFSTYSAGVITPTLVQFNPVPDFLLVCDYLTHHHLFDVQSPQISLDTADVSHNTSAELKAKGYYLPISKIMDFRINFQEIDPNDELPKSVCEALTFAIQVQLLLGAIENPQNISQESLTQLYQFFIQGKPSRFDQADFSEKKVIIDIFYHLKETKFTVEKKSALKIYQDCLLNEIKEIKKLPVHDQLKEYITCLRDIKANDLPQVEQIIHQIVHAVLSKPFTTTKGHLEMVNQLLAEFHRIGLLPEKVTVTSLQDFAVMQYLYQSSGEMYPDNAMIELFKQEIRKSPANTSFDDIKKQLRAQYEQLSASSSDASHLDRCHQLLARSSENAPQLYYLFHFNNNANYASKAYTYRIFQRELMIASNFTIDERQKTAFSKDFNYAALKQPSVVVIEKPENTRLAGFIELYNAILTKKNLTQLRISPDPHKVESTMKMLNERLQDKNEKDTFIKYLARELLKEIPTVSNKTPKITLTPTKGNLLEALRATDRVNSCLLSRNKRHTTNKVSFVVALESLQFNFDIAAQDKKQAVSGVVNCTLGYTNHNGVKIPTLFVDNPLSQGELSAADYELIVNELEKQALALGCHRVQLFFENQRDKFSNLSGYKKMDESVYDESSFRLISSLTADHGETLWPHGHMDWGEKLNCDVTVASELHRQCLSKDIVANLQLFEVLPVDKSDMSEAKWRTHQQNLQHILAGKNTYKAIITADGKTHPKLEFINPFHNKAYLVLQDHALAKQLTIALNETFPLEKDRILAEYFLLEFRSGMLNYISSNPQQNEWLHNALENFLETSNPLSKNDKRFFLDRMNKIISKYENNIEAWHRTTVAGESQKNPVAVLTQEGGMTHLLQTERVQQAVGRSHCTVFNESRDYKDTPLEVATGHTHTWVTNEVKSDASIPNYKQMADDLQRELQPMVKSFVQDTSRAQLVRATNGCSLVINTNTWAHNAFLAGMPGGGCEYLTLDQAHNTVNYCIAPLLQLAEEFGLDEVTYLGQPHTIASLAKQAHCQPIQPLVDSCYFETPLDKATLLNTINQNMQRYFPDKRLDPTKKTLFISTGGQVAGKAQILKLIERLGNDCNIVVLCADNKEFMQQCLSQPNSEHVFALPKVSNEWIAPLMLYADISLVKPGSPMVNQSIVCKHRNPNTEYFVLNDNREQERGNLEIMKAQVQAREISADASHSDGVDLLCDSVTKLRVTQSSRAVDEDREVKNVTSAPVVVNAPPTLEHVLKTHYLLSKIRSALIVFSQELGKNIDSGLKEILQMDLEKALKNIRIVTKNYLTTEQSDPILMKAYQVQLLQIVTQALSSPQIVNHKETQQLLVTLQKAVSDYSSVTIAVADEKRVLLNKMKEAIHDERATLGDKGPQQPSEFSIPDKKPTK